MNIDLQLVKEAEKLAMRLDHAVYVNEIENSELDEIKKNIKSISNQLHENIRLYKSDSYTYIVYETEALLEWIQGNEEATRQKIIKALDTKGNRNLFSGSAKKLLKYFNITDSKPWYKRSLSTKTLIILFICTGGSLLILILALAAYVQETRTKRPVKK